MPRIGRADYSLYRGYVAPMVEYLNPLGADFWASVGMAVLCGGMVGFERQARGKPAGIRTSILICLGTQTFVELGLNVQGGNIDPTRVLGQVITGIGFLGAGVIMTQGGLVKGVTSAAVVWMLAAVGSVIGFGQYATALALSLLTLMVLTGVEWLEARVLWLRKGAHAPDPNPTREE